jgi:hypothetical protein
MAHSRRQWTTPDVHELTKVLVDYYKHLSTLSGAGIVVMLAIYREDVVERFLVAYTVVSFAVTILACLAGIMQILLLFHRPLRLQEHEPVPLPFMTWAAAYFFGNAIITSLLTLALSIAFLATLGGVMICSALLLLWLLKKNSPVWYRRLRGQEQHDQEDQE